MSTHNKTIFTGTSNLSSFDLFFDELFLSEHYVTLLPVPTAQSGLQTVCSLRAELLLLETYYPIYTIWASLKFGVLCLCDVRTPAPPCGGEAFWRSATPVCHTRASHHLPIKLRDYTSSLFSTADLLGPGSGA